MEVIEHHRQAGAPAPERPPRGLEGLLARPGVAVAVLLSALLATVLAWRVSLDYAVEQARVRFAQRTDELHASLERQLVTSEALLHGGAGLFAAQQNRVDRQTWHQFVQALDIARRHPGVQGLGVARWVRPEALAAHERGLQAEGLLAYHVHPEGLREGYGPVTYLEPDDRRNRRAFGYDMHAEAVRREAMDRARASGKAAMSGIVRLVQEDGHAEQSGFLLYLPLYGKRSDAGAADAFWGWVYAPFRVGDLVHAALTTLGRDLRLSLHDGPTDSQPAFYASSPPADRPVAESARLSRTLHFGGRTWTAVYEPLADAATPAIALPTLVAGCGLLIDLLLCLMLVLGVRRHRLIERAVARRTSEVAARTAWLDAVSGLSPDGTLVFERDAQGALRLVFTNPAFSQLFGLRPQELLGLTEAAVDEWLAGLGHHRELPPLSRSDATLHLAGPPERVLQRSAREDGQQRVYYFRDITREREVEQLKNEFLTTAAHELRTPLACVYGYAELLTAPALGEAKRLRLSDVVYRQAGVLKHLVDELLDLARLDTRHGRDFQFDVCDLRAIVETACETAQGVEPSHPLHCRLGARPLWVRADAAKIGQAVVNALSNAMKYLPIGSPVTLEAGPHTLAGVAGVRLQVRDQGRGMTAAQCERAFERFYRADPSGHILGAGLGLAITREVMHLHQGRVWLDSTPGVGTCLSLWLPGSTAPRPLAAEAAATVTS